MPGPPKKAESKRNDPYWKQITHFYPEPYEERMNDVVKWGKDTGHGPQDKSELIAQALEKYLPSMERYLKAEMKRKYG